MIDQDTCSAIFKLHQGGMSLREISRRLQVSRNAVRKIVKQQGKTTPQERKDRIHIDAELLERLYRECDGWVERIHEKLLEEEKVYVGYSTLSRMLRNSGLSRNRPTRCDRVPDLPESEHGTLNHAIVFVFEHWEQAGDILRILDATDYLHSAVTYERVRRLQIAKEFSAPRDATVFPQREVEQAVPPA